MTSKDKAYPWVLQWLNKHAEASKSTIGPHITVDTITQRLANGQARARASSSRARPGRHVLMYEGHIMMIDRVREQQTVDLHTGMPWECVKLTALGRSRSLFTNFLAEAQEHAEAKQELTTTVYTNWGTEWRPFGAPRRRRPLHSVVLDEGVSEHVLRDVQERVESPNGALIAAYRIGAAISCTAPSRMRQVLLCRRIGGELGYDICVLNLSDAGLTDDRLAHALSTTPPTSLILLEDVDAAFVQREAAEGAPGRRRQSMVTFSGLLNALDGVAAGEERILFMTTNHIEKLDPALIRPGRVDVIHHIGYASRAQCVHMFLKFFPTETRLAELFAASAAPSELSMALLQSYFMLYRGQTARAACDGAAELAAGALAASSSGGAAPMQQQLAERQVQQQLQLARLAERLGAGGGEQVVGGGSGGGGAAADGGGGADARGARRAAAASAAAPLSESGAGGCGDGGGRGRARLRAAAAGSGESGAGAVCAPPKKLL